MKPVVFVDMDGLLSDFAMASLRTHGISAPMEAITAYDFGSVPGMPVVSSREFWVPLENADWWAALDPHPDGMDLFARIESAVGPDRVTILSSGQCLGSPEGKRRWLDRHLPGYSKKTIFASAKHYCAGPGKVLVEDHEANADKFVENGGHAVLVPRPWNRRRGECKANGTFCPMTAMTELRDILGTIGG